VNVLIFGATGMIGQGVLRESLLDPDVQRVVTIGRSATGQQHPKLEEIVHRDLHDYSAIEPRLTGFDACFFCLGIASAGLSEEEYHRVTYGIAVAAAETLLRLNPGMTFIFVSGTGADSTERGRTMWARVKGKAENAILRMSFKGAYVFRPAFIQPLHGIRSRTRLYRVFYTILKPVLPLLRRALPRYATTTEIIGRAMLNIARNGADVRVLETPEINRHGQR
jgi:uncharacterized protein YbjT (DUF2867 family)